MNITKPCEQCGAPVTRVPSTMTDRTIYCSVACKAAAQRVTTTRACDYCGKTITRAPSQMTTFCSSECAHLGIQRRETKPCQTCGKSVTRPRSQMVKTIYCSPACSRAGLRKEQTTTRRMLRLPDHPLAGRGDLVPEYRAILYDALGPGTHPCHWCQTLVTWMPGAGPVSGALVVDHVNNDPLDNSPDNLVPSCQQCNGTRNSPVKLAPGEVFKVMADGRRLRAQERACERCGQSFLATIGQINDGKGRFCSRSCARSQPRDR